MAAREKIRIFPKRLERIYLGALAIALALGFLSLFVPVLRNFQREVYSEVICSFLFLNSAHTVFTFAMLIRLPEFRAWLKSAMIGHLKYHVLVVTGLIVIAYLVGSYSGNPYLRAINLAVTVSLLALHNISQTKGLSLLYNRAARETLTPEEQLRANRVEKTERLLFSLLAVSILIQQFAAGVREMKGAFADAYFFTALALAIGLIANSFRYPKRGESNKTYFLGGTLLYSMFGLNAIGPLVQRSLHGLEYAFLTTKMSRQSRMKKAFGFSLAISMTFALILLGMAFLKKALPREILSAQTISVMVFISFMIEFLHYYFDSLLFRMSDPAVREHILPLCMDQTPDKVSIVEDRPLKAVS